MSKLLMLTKVLIKNSVDIWGKSPKSKAQLIKKVVLFLVFAVAFLPLVLAFGYMVSGAYDLLVPVGQEGALLSLSLSLVSMVIFFFGIFYVISVFYFTKDIEYLLPLPLKPWEILGAKFLVALLYEYLSELVFLLPVLIVFGLKSGGGVYYYLSCLVIYLILPVIPLVLASVMMMVLMGFTGLVKNKDRFRLGAGILGIFLAVGFNVFFQKFSGSAAQGEELAKLIMEGNNSLLNISFGIFPQTKLGAYALVSPAGEGIIYLFLLLLATLLALAVFALLGQALYFKGVMGISETSARRKKVDQERLTRETVRSTILKAYTMKELKLLFRTPVYFMNCVMMNFLWPVFFLIPFIAQPGLRQQLGLLSGFVKNPETAGYIVAGIFALGAFVTAANGVTSTAISREGENIFVTKYLPVDFKKQILAKVFSGIILGWTGMLLIILTIGLLLGMPFYVILLLLFSGAWGVLFSSLAGMALDLNFPKLHWDNEQKAVKQNLNVMIMIMIAVVFSGLILFGVIKMHLGLATTLMIIFGLGGLLNLLLYRYLITKGAKLFAAL
ncbi:MAG: hypothetical protein AAGU27_15460 [Dehalobacterium sp.]